MNYTANYQLNQWEETDRILRTDFNADNAKIDAAIAARSCQFYMATYTGTGSGTLTFTFPHKPMLVVVMSSEQPSVLFGVQGVDDVFLDYLGNGFSTPAVWEGNSVSWQTTTGGATYSASGQTSVYPLLALLDADQKGEQGKAPGKCPGPRFVTIVTFSIRKSQLSCRCLYHLP